MIEIAHVPGAEQEDHLRHHRVGRRGRLKLATQSAHARLDEVADRAGFFDSRRSYLAYLHATLRARRALEVALDASQAVTLFPPWSHRRMTEALCSDVHDLTGNFPHVIPETVPDLTAAQVVGVLYVLEGSALGARILKQRAERIGMSPTFGGCHLDRQTSLPKTWSAFLSLLEMTILNDDEEIDCIDAAIDAFARFERHYLGACASADA